jgi:long-chain acyl-CoA synthetase
VSNNLTCEFLKAAKAYPDKVAIVYGKERIVYSELRAQIVALYHSFMSVGVKEDDAVCVILPNSPIFVSIFYALNAIGVKVLPTNSLFKPEEIKYYLDDSGARYLIGEADKVKSLCESSVGVDEKVQLITIGGEVRGSLSIETLLDNCISKPMAIGQTDALTLKPGRDALYLYSSGSTGKPKCVPRTNEQLLAEVHGAKRTIGYGEKDVFLCLVPMYHAHGLGNCMLAATCHGGTLVLLEPVVKNGKSVDVPFVFRCQRVFDLIQQEQVTIFPCVPYVFKALAEARVKVEPDLGSLRLCFSGGNFLPQETFEAFRNRFSIPVRQLYGCTEAGIVAVNLADELDSNWNSVGAEILGLEVEIVDDYGASVAVNEVGEIKISGSSLTKGYADRGQLNTESFVDGAYLTGDLGRIDESGDLYVVGRKKILIDTGGRKVDPIEVEDVLRGHPSVEESVVVGVKQDVSSGDEVVKAVIVCRKDAILTDDDVFSYCSQMLSGFKIPKIIEFRDEIPKSPLGKVLRKELV